MCASEEMQELMKRELVAQIHTNKQRLSDLGADQKEMNLVINFLKNKITNFVMFDEFSEVKKKMSDFAPMFMLDRIDKQLSTFTTLS